MPIDPFPNPRQHYPALDGLRGIAILLVILYHNFGFIEYFNYGWLGVDLFFVLSGFLITDILLHSVHSENYFRNFYARRILRIMPLYYLSLILFILVLPAIPSFPLNMSYYQEHQAWFWTYLQNWTLIFKQEGDTSALGHFWSLAVEEQYYLVWPLVILLIRDPKKVLMLSLLLLVGVITARFLIWQNRDQYPSYERLFLFTRLDGILIGSMLACIQILNRTLIRRYFTIFLILLTVANYLFYFFKKGQDPDFPSWAIAGFTTFSILFAMLTYEAVIGAQGAIGRALQFMPLRLLGKYSYGFYIFHWPVFLILNPLWKDWLSGSGDPNSFLIQFVSATLSSLAGFLISILSFHLFEQHFLRLKGYFIG